MARDDKKMKHTTNQKKNVGDKDIHLNVLGIPQNNVQVNKASHVGSDNYQLYKISIDTKNKDKEKKVLLGNFEPTLKRVKKRKEEESRDKEISSSDSGSRRMRSPRHKASAGQKKEKDPYSKTRKKRPSDSEICFTIPGEKGKAIKIVGSPVTDHVEKSPSTESEKPRKGKRGSSPRQVGFAKMDEVYGTSPEESTEESNDSIPYKKTSPQVYKVEHMPPDAWLKDLSKGTETGGRNKKEKPLSTKGTSKERRDPEEQEPHGSGPQIKRGKIDPRRSSTGKSGDKTAETPSSQPVNASRDHSEPRSSRGHHPHESALKGAPSSVFSSIPGTSYDIDTNNPEEEMSLGKGKYPYYPYNKAKRSIPQSAHVQDPELLGQNEEGSYKQEPFTHKKLPSIPEVRSFTEHTTAPLDSEDIEQHSSLKQPLGRKSTVKESTSPIHPNLVKSNDAEMQKSGTLPKPTQPHRTSEHTSPISKSQREPTLADGEINIHIDKSKKTNQPFNLSKSTSPISSTVQIVSDRIQQPTLSKIKKEPEVEREAPTYEKSKLPQPSKSIEKTKTSTSASPKLSVIQSTTDQIKYSESPPSKTQNESTSLGEDPSQATSRSLQSPKPSSQYKLNVPTSPVPSRERKIDGESKISLLPSSKTQSEQKFANKPVSRDQQKPIPGKKPSEKHTTGVSTSPILHDEPNKGAISFPYMKQKEINFIEEPIFTKNAVPSDGKYNAQQHCIQQILQETELTKQPYKHYRPNLEVKPETVSQRDGTLNKMLPGTPRESNPIRDGLQNQKSPAQSFQNVKTPFSISQSLGKSANSTIVTTASKRISPLMVDKEILTDAISGKENGSKIIPTHFSSGKTSKEEVPQIKSTSREKEPKSSKSRLSAFVSSIPKPFRRSSSPTSLEKQNAKKNVGSMMSQHKDGQLKTLSGRPDIKNETRKPVAESITKQLYEQEKKAYPVWKMSSERQRPDNQKTTKPKPLSNLSQKSVTAAMPERANSDWVKEKTYLPVVILDSPSLEISNRTFGEQPFTERASRIQETPFQIAYRHTSTEPSRMKVVEEVSKSIADLKEDKPPNFLRLKNDSNGASFGSSEKIGRRDSTEELESGKKEAVGAAKFKTPNKSDEVDGFELYENKDRFDWDGLEMPDYNYGKAKDGFGAPTVIAYPGQVNEQTPFGYDSTYEGDPYEEDLALISLENAFEARDQPDRYKNIQKSDLSLPNRIDSNKSGKPEDNLLSHEQPKFFVNDGEEGWSSSYTYPTSKGNKVSDALPASKEKVFDSKLKPPKDFSKPKTEKDILKYSSDAMDDKKDKISKPPDKSVFWRTPDEHIVFAARVPDTNSKVFLASGSSKDRGAKREKPAAEGPKGILIFVNRKNETSNPFEKSGKGRIPQQESESYSSKTKKTDNRPGKKGKKRKSQTSSDNTFVTTSVGSGVGAGGDKKVQIQRSPSGTRITQRHPCGCIRILSSDPNNQLKKEEIMSAYCKYGSQCEISNPQLRKGELMIPMDESITSGGTGERHGDSVRLFPDIEVIADGVVSRKPIKPRSPAPTMKGANFTGTLNIKSNRLNGVYNFYLDSKLKQYLRNNIDKFKVLLEDDARR